MTRTSALILTIIAALFLCSPLTGHAHGQTIPVAKPAPSSDTPQSPPAADAAQAADPALASPRVTMFTFLQAMTDFQNASTQGARRAAIRKAVSTLDAPDGLLEGSEWAIARDLYTVLGRIDYVEAHQLPDSGDSSTSSGSFTYYPQPTIIAHANFNSKHPGYIISLSRDEAGQWKFSRQTVDTIHDFAIKTEQEPTVAGGKLDKSIIERVRDAIPASLKGSTSVGLEHWQWIGIFTIILVGMILDRITRSVLRTLWHRIERHRGNTAEEQTLAQAVRPFGLLVAAGVWYLALTLGMLPPTPTVVLLVAVRVIWIIAIVWGAFKLTDLVAEWLAAKAAGTETKFDDLLIPLLKRTIKLFVSSIGIIYMANAFSIEILPLLTGLGIGGIAVAFAAKDTIENFFGSVAVILDRPFEIGDWILVNDVEGTVEDLGFRSTRIRTFYNSLVTVPNATLVRAKVDNYGRRKYRRYKTTLNVTYSTPPEKIEAFCAGIREIVKLHPYTRKDYYHVWLNGFGAHSLDILVYIFFECPDWSIELREKHRFMLDVVRLADRLGVEFAFPTQTLHIDQLDPNAAHNPANIPDTDSERRAVLEGRKMARELTGEQPWRTEKPGPVSFAEEFDSEWEARGDSAG